MMTDRKKYMQTCAALHGWAVMTGSICIKYTCSQLADECSIQACFPSREQDEWDQVVSESSQST